MISEVLHQIRQKRIGYSANDDWTIPLNWTRLKSGMTFAIISKEHAQMLAAASLGKDLAPHSMTLKNHDNFLGVGKNGLTLMKAANGKYAIKYEPLDFENPKTLPESIDLSQRLKPPEEPDTRPNEMLPEDYYS